MFVAKHFHLGLIIGLLGGFLASFLFFADHAVAIPAFARKYQTSCQTCHSMPPKLNAFGEAYRLNSYQIPDGDEPHIKDTPLVTAAPAWKDVWPKSIWPGWIPGSPPSPSAYFWILRLARTK